MSRIRDLFSITVPQSELLFLYLLAAERHQSKAKRFSAAETGGHASCLHHSTVHTCHPPSLFHPGGPAGLWGL